MLIEMIEDINGILMIQKYSSNYCELLSNIMRVVYENIIIR